MTYYMLFKRTPEEDLDTPFGIHAAKAEVNALCVFSSDEAAAVARDEAKLPPGFYMEAVAPDHVVALTAIFGVGVVALDPYYQEPYMLMDAVDAVETLTELAQRSSSASDS